MLRILFYSFIFWGTTAFALQESSAPPEPVVEQVDLTPLRQVGSEYHNGIKLLQNRFRIDYMVDEITMVFFRKFGSTPVVLVRPDGSKIFQGQADEHGIEWYDSTTYDMIKMQKPTPGPWQAVGQILPGSRVMVLSDIELKATPLPTTLFSGEILKQTAFLTNGGKPIDYAEFRDVVKLTMEFVSTNNPNFNNFGAQTQVVATFEDDGRGMDESPLDGTFTGQFNLAIADGQWKPVFNVITPMYSREQVGENLILYPNPIKLEAQLDDSGSGYHTLIVDADRSMVDMNSVLVDGKIKFPNGDVQNFSITQVSDDVRTHKIVNYEYGIFRVKITAYGNTLDGRDFILDVPEYTFLAEEPMIDMSTVEQNMPLEAPDDAASAEQLAMQEIIALQNAPVEEGMSTNQMVMWIIILNLVIFGLGGGALWYFFLRGKSKPKETAPGTVQENAFITFVTKLTDQLNAIMSKAKPKKKDKKEKSKDEDDAAMIDLSMPE